MAFRVGARKDHNCQIKDEMVGKVEMVRKTKFLR